jgi:hypothetical protein
MRSLASLVRSADAGDLLASAVSALLDSGFVITLRDDRGALVQQSQTAADALDIHEDMRGQEFWRAARFFDGNGREIAPADYPAQVVRLTGQPQRARLIGLRSRTGAELWMIMSWLPIARGPAGWSVLSIGAPLPPQVFIPPTQRQETDPVMDFALEVAGKRLDPEALAERLGRPAGRIAPAVSCLLAWRDGEELRLLSVWRPDGRAGEVPSVTEVPLTGETATRWAMAKSYVNLNVRETDIIGNRVAVEYDRRIRTYALIPIRDGCGVRTASFALTSPNPDALTTRQVESFERLGVFAGAAFDSPWLHQQAAA